MCARDCRTAAGGSANKTPKKSKLCQALGCKVSLQASGKRYCLKHRLCTAHLKALAIEVPAFGPGYWRFCQQCGKLEPLHRFESTKRSCKSSLMKRKQQSASRAEQQQQQWPRQQQQTHPEFCTQQSLLSQECQRGVTNETAGACEATMQCIDQPIACQTLDVNCCHIMPKLEVCSVAAAAATATNAAQSREDASGSALPPGAVTAYSAHCTTQEPGSYCRQLSPPPAAATAEATEELIVNAAATALAEAWCQVQHLSTDADESAISADLQELDALIDAFLQTACCSSIHTACSPDDGSDQLPAQQQLTIQPTLDMVQPGRHCASASDHAAYAPPCMSCSMSNIGQHHHRQQQQLLQASSAGWSLAPAPAAAAAEGGGSCSRIDDLTEAELDHLIDAELRAACVIPMLQSAACQSGMLQLQEHLPAAAAAAAAAAASTAVAATFSAGVAPAPVAALSCAGGTENCNQTCFKLPVGGSSVLVATAPGTSSDHGAFSLASGMHRQHSVGHSPLSQLTDECLMLQVMLYDIPCSAGQSVALQHVLQVEQF